MADTQLRLEVEQVINQLGLADGPWRREWSASASTWPESIGCWHKEYLQHACTWLCMGKDVSSIIVEAASCFDHNPALQGFFCHCRHILIEKEKYDFEDFMALPAPGKDVPLFFVFVFLAALPVVRDIHRQRGIPENVSIDTLSDLELWIRTYQQWYGQWGFEERNWLFHHFRGNLFKLGRLQFLLECFEDDLHLFCHEKNSDLKLLAPDGAKYRRDGQFDGSNGIWEEQPGIAEYRETDLSCTGVAIAPQGRITGEKVQLTKGSWRCTLKKGDPALSFHIPATGPMEPGACWESLAQAMDFFRNYFPEITIHAFFSHSWLYDYQLEGYLPAHSNILRFQRAFYLYPLPLTNDHQILERVFGRACHDLEGVQPKTSLQRAVLDHIRQGGRWRTCGALLLPERIPGSSSSLLV